MRFVARRWEIVSNRGLSCAVKSHFPSRVFERTGNERVVTIANDFDATSKIQFAIDGVYDECVIPAHAIERNRMQHRFGVRLHYRAVDFHLDHRIVERRSPNHHHVWISITKNYRAVTNQ